MTTNGSASRLPQPNPECLHALSRVDVAAAYVTSQKGRRSGRADAVTALGGFFDAGQALAEALLNGRLQETSGVLQEVESLTQAEQAHSSISQPWPEVLRAFAFRALGAPPAAMNGKRKSRDLAAVALRQVYGLETLSPSPSRGEVRCELLRRIAATLGEPVAAHVSQTPKSFKFDPLSRRIYLSFAGLNSGSVLQADAALLSSAFGGSAGTVADLSATIVRAALKAQGVEARKREEAFDLDGFAESVRELARKLETKPYAGRVAIAQVYDAGLEEGLDLGSLDDFKSHLAEAAREGLLDLERYDITGSLDAGLKERSRLRLGRDERHFIVNQWI